MVYHQVKIWETLLLLSLEKCIHTCIASWEKRFTLKENNNKYNQIFISQLLKNVAFNCKSWCKFVISVTMLCNYIGRYLLNIK